MEKTYPKIIAILLIKNEDLFIEQVILNIIDFCDKIYIADNNSTDHTYKIIKNLSIKYSKIECSQISHPKESHTLIEKYAGTNTWIFGVDGDEIYDPVGLSLFKKRILHGEFDQWWLILSNMYHCTQINLKLMQGKGYSAPPGRSVTKLYNFNVISEWSGCQEERLHSGMLIFKDGYSDKLRRNLYKEYSWEESNFRCLHVCFLARSSMEKSNHHHNRKNPAEIAPFRGMIGTIRYLWYKIKGVETKPHWKTNWYKKGELETINIKPFFN